MRTTKPGSARVLEGRAEKRPVRLKIAFDLPRYLQERKKIVERALQEAVTENGGLAGRLHEAMRYSLLSGGKRLRPILTLAACESVGGEIAHALPAACAIEMIHTYSMMHDDLPCMDDDDLRRGKPTNHKVFGDAMATLAGDALLTDAFLVLANVSQSKVRPSTMVRVIAEIAEAAGSRGMVAGQAIDIMSENQPTDIGAIEYLHGKKTGALFTASLRTGAMLGDATAAQLESLTVYARAVGLAFQVVDDILDVESSPDEMGKRTQKDSHHGKATYPVLLGLQKSHDFSRELETRAIEALAGFDRRAEPLREIARYVVERSK